MMNEQDIDERVLGPVAIPDSIIPVYVGLAPSGGVGGCMMGVPRLTLENWITKEHSLMHMNRRDICILQGIISEWLSTYLARRSKMGIGELVKAENNEE